MAITKITTPTDLPQPALAVLAVLLGVFACINVFSSMTPSTDANERIEKALNQSDKMDLTQRAALFNDLRAQQEVSLQKNPAEPFAWARLAYFRLVTQKDKEAAFAALRMSDFVSPNDPRQLPERAAMWYDLRNVEDESQQARQDDLWVKAYRTQPGITRDLTAQKGLLNDVAKALQAQDADLYEKWQRTTSGR
ncbi:MAG: hypothetical protein HY053_05390 [Proteobacteria bacterium]|nr:hypothetical protein [Pseudomonadota bacterium]